MSAESGRNELLHTLYDGLTRRPAPQDVAVTLVDLGIDQHLPAAACTALHDLARVGALEATGSSMTSSYRQHPGLHRAFAAADAAMRAVTTAAKLPVLRDADANDPQSLTAWLTAAHAMLGLDTTTYREPHPTRSDRAATRTYTWQDWVWPDELAPVDGTSLTRWELRLLEDTGDEPEPYTTVTRTETRTYTRRPRGPRGQTGGHVDVRTRYNAQQRTEHLPGVSVRTYRRAVRVVAHLEQRTGVLAAERDREKATAYGKGRLAHTITYANFAACEFSAAFVAYYTARLGMRTQFTSGSQDRPMDGVAQALLDAALAAPTCRPDVIAAVLTQRKVLAQLDDSDRGVLLGRTYAHLAAAARVLRSAYDPGRTTMVVRRGDDSSSWNGASRAFNQARTGLLNVTAALGLDQITQATCPGKVPALIASDVAYWHTTDGGDQEHVDTLVFRDLPLPWDVVLGGVTCTAQQVTDACAAHGVDAAATGWTQAYYQGEPAVTAPAPDLVHGCVITSPELARAMRAAGWFSGQR